MDRKEKVMKRLQEHYDYLVNQGHEVVFLATKVRTTII